MVMPSSLKIQKLLLSAKPGHLCKQVNLPSQWWRWWGRVQMLQHVLRCGACFDGQVNRWQRASSRQLGSQGVFLPIRLCFRGLQRTPVADSAVAMNLWHCAAWEELVWLTLALQLLHSSTLNLPRSGFITA